MVRRCKHRRRVAALGFGVVFGSTFGVSALAQEDKVEEVLVTGSRIAREGLDTSTPVNLISTEEIKLSGAPNVEKILSDAPQFVASTNGGASANTVPGGTADVNLRGFGPELRGGVRSAHQDSRTPASGTWLANSNALIRPRPGRCNSVSRSTPSPQATSTPLRPAAMTVPGAAAAPAHASAAQHFTRSPFTTKDSTPPKAFC